MIASLWGFDAGNLWWHFPLRAFVVFAMVLIFLRVTGKRQIGQMAPFDLVLLLLISNAVQNSMNGGDNSITAGVLLAGTLIIMDWGLGVLSRRFRKVETLMEGQEELLIHNGKILEAALQRSGMTRHELMAGLRASGCASVDRVHAAILETNGRISVLPKPEKS